MEGLDERALFDQGPVVIFRWRNEDGWPVEYVSSNAESVFGYTDKQFLDGDIDYASLIHPDDAKRVGAEVAAGATGTSGSFIHAPYRIIHADGNVRWIYDATHVLRSTNASSPTHFLGYVIDVTQRIVAEQERHALELKIFQTQKLESLGSLAAGVAHDFNNLLTGILGETELAKLLVERKQTDVHRSLDSIEKLALQAAVLTRQLLAYSGNYTLTTAPIELGPLAKDVANLIRPILSRKATLDLRIESTSKILADPTQLHQVVMNLITNASDALNGACGTITIRVFEDDRICLGRPEPIPCVTLVVSDNGVGMNDRVKSLLFDPFFTTKPTGHGLGLSAVQGIMRSHGGEIHVTSKPGEGSTFELRFPGVNLPGV